jgi:hypothetical protein
MYLMSADSLQGQVGGGWHWKSGVFLNGIEPIGECHLGSNDSRWSLFKANPLPLAQVMDLQAYRDV